MNKSCTTIPKVSVIIPVYRSLEHIRDTLSCLQQQTLRELELIFIDDKGGDGTFDIIKEASLTDPRIVCLENEVNSGPGVARNKGIEAARGEFIAFVDADDCLSPDFYEKLYHKAKETGALAVKAVRYNVEADGRRIKNKLTERIKEEIEREHESMLNLWTYEHTAGIYSRDIVMQTGARNCTTARHDEDTCFLMMLMIHVKPSQVAIEETAEYYYIQRESSLIHKPKDAYYLEQMRLSAEFKINFMMLHMTSEDNANYISGIIQSRLTTILDSVEGGDVEHRDIVGFISYFAGVIRKWHASGLPYFEHSAAALLRKLQYDASAFYAIRQWYAEMQETIRGLSQELRLIACGSILQKKLLKLKIKSWFAFGKRKKEIKAQRAIIKEKVRHYRHLTKLAQASLGV